MKGLEGKRGIEYVRLRKRRLEGGGGGGGGREKIRQKRTKTPPPLNFPPFGCKIDFSERGGGGDYMIHLLKAQIF